MTRKLVLFLGIIVFYTSCGKKNDQCPEGYGGADCLVPWSTSVIGVWRDETQTIVYGGYPFNIISSNSNPKAIKVQRSAGNSAEDFIGNMTSETSFSFEPAVFYEYGSYKAEILSGIGNLNASGFEISGSMTFRETDASVGSDTTYTLNYIWKK